MLPRHHPGQPAKTLCRRLERGREQRIGKARRELTTYVVSAWRASMGRSGAAILCSETAGKANLMAAHRLRRLTAETRRRGERQSSLLRRRQRLANRNWFFAIKTQGIL